MITRRNLLGLGLAGAGLYGLNKLELQFFEEARADPVKQELGELLVSIIAASENNDIESTQKRDQLCQGYIDNFIAGQGLVPVPVKFSLGLQEYAAQSTSQAKELGIPDVVLAGNGCQFSSPKGTYVPIVETLKTAT